MLQDSKFPIILLSTIFCEAKHGEQMVQTDCGEKEKSGEGNAEWSWRWRVWLMTLCWEGKPLTKKLLQRLAENESEWDGFGLSDKCACEFFWVKKRGSLQCNSMYFNWYEFSYVAQLEWLASRWLGQHPQTTVHLPATWFILSFLFFYFIFKSNFIVKTFFNSDYQTPPY